MKVFQHIDEYFPYDGMGMDCRGIRFHLENLGIENYIVTRKNGTNSESGVLHPEGSDFTKPDSVHILHYGGSGYPLSRFFQFKGKKILRFHNVTPPEFFLGGNPGTFLAMEKFYSKSIFELVSMRFRMDHCYSVSEENLRMLRDFSDLPASILPIVREYGSRNTERNESQISFRKRISSGYIDPVYVGRIVPNKKIEDLVRFFYFWKQIYPDAILRIIGSEITGFLDYSRFIKTTIQDLGLKDSIQFISGVSESEKRKILSDSGFFLSMSEHEGFCIPLIEAMEAKIPVFAFGSSAVPETLRKGGILFFNKDFLFLRELVAHFLEDDLLHEKILHSQKRALHFYESYPFQEKIQEILESGREIKSFVFDSKNPLLRKSI